MTDPTNTPPAAPSAEAIDALRELLEKATPGPWTSSYFGDGQFVVTMPRDRSLRFHPRPPSGCDSQSATVYGAPGMAKTLPGDVIVGMAGHELDGLTEQEYANQRVADGQLIVALRNAAPALLAAHEAQRKEIERLNAGWQECLDALAIARNTLAAGADERDALRSTVQQRTEQRDALKAEIADVRAAFRQSRSRLGEQTRENIRLGESVGRLFAERDRFEAKLSASERKVEELKCALERILIGQAATWVGDECRAALRGEEAPRGE